MSTLENVAGTAVDQPAARPPAATGRGSLLAAELGRLRHRRLIVALVVLALIGLVAAMAVVFATHSTDLAGARAEAAAIAQQAAAEQQQAEAECRQSPETPADQVEEICDFGEPPTAADQFVDPRFVAGSGLPLVALGVAVGGALLAVLLGATAVGADWSSRTVITLLTWEPRRLRLLGTRLAAIALATLGIGVVGQALGLGLGALTVWLRGTWAAPAVATDPEAGPAPSPALLPPAHFWRDLLSLHARGIVLMVLAAVLAAAITAMTRHTAGLLGLLFFWFVLVENAARVLGSQRGWPRWLVSENALAFLLPGGQDMTVGTEVTAEGETARSVLVSNLDALLYLGALTAAAALIAGVLLRRRDL